VVKTLRPENYNEVFYVGDYFRGDTPVVMDLSGFSDADAVPLIDFAAGLVVGLRGIMERVAPKVFLLLPEPMVAQIPVR
jgi:cell division inhibitor SepF